MKSGRFNLRVLVTFLGLLLNAFAIASLAVPWFLPTIPKFIGIVFLVPSYFILLTFLVVWPLLCLKEIIHYSIQYFVRCLQKKPPTLHLHLITGGIIKVNFSGSSILELKEAIQRSEGIPKHSQMLLSRGRLLHNEDSIPAERINLVLTLQAAGKSETATSTTKKSKCPGCGVVRAPRTVHYHKMNGYPTITTTAMMMIVMFTMKVTEDQAILIKIQPH